MVNGNKGLMFMGFLSIFLGCLVSLFSWGFRFLDSDCMLVAFFLLSGFRFLIPRKRCMI